MQIILGPTKTKRWVQFVLQKGKLWPDHAELEVDGLYLNYHEHLLKGKLWKVSDIQTRDFQKDAYFGGEMLVLSAENSEPAWKQYRLAKGEPFPKKARLTVKGEEHPYYVHVGRGNLLPQHQINIRGTAARFNQEILMGLLKTKGRWRFFRSRPGQFPSYCRILFEDGWKTYAEVLKSEDTIIDPRPVFFFDMTPKQQYVVSPSSILPLTPQTVHKMPDNWKPEIQLGLGREEEKGYQCNWNYGTGKFEFVPFPFKPESLDFDYVGMAREESKRLTQQLSLYDDLKHKKTFEDKKDELQQQLDGMLELLRRENDTNLWETRIQEKEHEYSTKERKYSKKIKKMKDTERELMVAISLLTVQLEATKPA